MLKVKKCRSKKYNKNLNYLYFISLLLFIRYQSKYLFVRRNLIKSIWRKTSAYCHRFKIRSNHTSGKLHSYNSRLLSTTDLLLSSPFGVECSQQKQETYTHFRNMSTLDIIISLFLFLKLVLVMLENMSRKSMCTFVFIIYKVITHNLSFYLFCLWCFSSIDNYCCFFLLMNLFFILDPCTSIRYYELRITK